MVERAARVTAPGVLALFVVIGAALSNQATAVVVSGAVSAAAVGLFLGVRATTGWPLALGALLAAAAVTVVCSGQPSNLGWFAICVLAGWCALASGTAAAVSVGCVLVLGFLAQWLAVSDEPGWGAWIAGTAFTTAACIFARRQRVLLDQLREAQAGLADQARSEERHRIAREMHDVIGHALTVSLLHISSARLAIDDDPEEARRSLAEAEQLSRRSLEEVRAAVGVMRDGTSEVTPLPGAADLAALVDSFRRAGTPVSCEIVGDPERLTATTGLAAYRIVQEALTNAARHGSGAATSLRVEVTDDVARVTVDSAGAPSRRTTYGAGLVGMRERAQSVGGRLTAGPGGLGWRVEAVLPL
jgi:signal transduction histidine kinase